MYIGSSSENNEYWSKQGENRIKIEFGLIFCISQSLWEIEINIQMR